MPIITTPLNGRAEAGQDHFAYEMCHRKTNGTFIDIGCNEPIRWNNTYALEEIGWRGIGLDIEPSYVPMWAKERQSPFCLADATTFDWARIFPHLTAPLDYLSLDIDENPERNLATRILENLFAAGMVFRCATIEHDGYRFGDHPREEIRALMIANGYTCAYANVEIRQGCGKPFEDWWTR